MNESKAIALATKIKSQFGQPPTYSFTKGSQIYSYTEKDKGYWLKVYAASEAEAKGLIQKILAIQNHEINYDFFNLSNKPSKSSINNPPVPGQSTVNKRRKNAGDPLVTCALGTRRLI